MRNTPILRAALLCALATGGPVEASVWTVPGTVNAGGLNNTRFVSDLAITNPGSIPVQATISFIPANGTTPVPITLNAGETVVYRNLLDRLWSAQGAGATQVASDASLLIRARTYNTAASGTYGVALPVFADDRLLLPGKPADSLWISQSADGSSGYRANVAVVFPDAGGGDATVTIYDAGGVEVGSQDFSLDKAGFQQFGVGSFAGAVSIARAEVQVQRGRAAGYSVVVDNVTGDSSLFSFEELPSGYQDVVVNGVARANGRNNTFFRTDGRFFNPTDEDVEIKVSFHAAGGSNPNPASRTFTVGAGRILDVIDVLGTLLGLPVGSAGAVRFETEASVGILCRTSNVDPLGVNPGTFGAQQKPTPLLSFLMSADAGAVITGIRQNTAFRTNVGFAAGPDGADYALSLKSTSGATVATATGSLGAFGWTQPNIQDLFPGSSIPDDATLQVRVTSGSVDVFDSSIDNASGDPVVTPIMPLPVSIPSSSTIGPQGGSVRSDDGRLTVKVPAGALAGSLTVALVTEASGVAGALGSGYVLTPSALPLAKPALLVFRAAGGPDPALGLANVGLVVKTDFGTFVGTGGRVDPSAGTLTVPVSTTSPASSTVKTSARGAALDARTVIVPASSLVIGPETLTVLTDGSITLGFTPQFPPSSGSAAAGYRPALSPADEASMRVRWTKPADGRLDSLTDRIVIYTGPHDINRGVGVLTGWKCIRVGAKVTIGSAPNVQRLDLKAILTIVQRNWKIASFLFIKEKCLDGLGYSLSWESDGDVPFVINDDGSIRMVGGQLETAKKPTWGTCGACTSIEGAAADGFSALDAVFISAGFDFKTLTIDIFAKSSYTLGPATLNGCSRDGGLPYSNSIDSRPGAAFIDEPYRLVYDRYKNFGSGDVLETLGITFNYIFQTRHAP